MNEIVKKNMILVEKPVLDERSEKLLFNYYKDLDSIIIDDCNVLKTDTIIPNKSRIINVETMKCNGHAFFKNITTFDNKTIFNQEVELNGEIIFNNQNTIKNIITEINKLGPVQQPLILNTSSPVVSDNPFVLFYSRNDLESSAEQHLIIPPAISAENCIYYLVVIFNDGMCYNKIKFYYKIGAKSPFEVLSKEYVNCDENKASIKYSDGSLKIEFKYNKSSIKNTKIRVYYSDI
ncbi:unknown similar to AMEV233 [Adoxophyes honmai entomopoxvirus 'L']|uniref:Uncharacterized protein n=1 Tax=Adoxophyes honmai entomopoxvirus 'L' TaxID=1293540 RepID=A0A916KP84_9POXV|nr:unknown similar to AMEV233 [Adoxophyes honmai entomopoxvirus 'L']CCU55533.1 unknown similar to AMEV233 [Adoxophyes honmai entomopoxvirus 'L']